MPEPLSVAERNDLAVHIAATLAPRLAAAVHRRDADDIAGLLASADRQDLLALAVVLANQVVIDDVAVERAIDGEPLPYTLTRPERAVAVHRLTALGHSPSVISKRLRMSGSQVLQLLGHQPQPNPQEGNAA